MTEQILVTGATGNVGSEVVKALRERGQPVVAAVRDIDKAQAKLGDDISYVAFDFKQPDKIAAALTGIKKVFLMRPPDISNVQRDVTPVLKAMKQTGVEHIVFLSILDVEQTKFIPHYKIEQAIKAGGFDYTFLRAGFFMQNLDTTHRDDIKKYNELYLPAGRGKTAFIDVRDIAAVAALALTENGHRNQAYDLTGNEVIDYYEVARDFTEVLNRNIRYIAASPFAFIQKMRQRQLAWPFILVMLILYTTVRFGRAAHQSNQTQQLLGRDPITMRQYIRDYQQVWI